MRPCLLTSLAWAEILRRVLLHFQKSHSCSENLDKEWTIITYVTIAIKLARVDRWTQSREFVHGHELMKIVLSHISELQIWPLLPLSLPSTDLLRIWLVNRIDLTHLIGSRSLNVGGSGSGSQIWSSLFLVEA